MQVCIYGEVSESPVEFPPCPGVAKGLHLVYPIHSTDRDFLEWRWMLGSISNVCSEEGWW